MPAEMRDLVEFGLEAHQQTMDLMRAGEPAGEVVIKYEEFVKERGYGEYLLYGPCHSIGLMEVERPWMESSSDYLLEADMVFQIDTFLYCPEYGLRWENGAVVTADGVDQLSGRFTRVIEL
jgi:Xaa-Pro aminopeptidase